MKVDSRIGRVGAAAKWRPTQDRSKYIYYYLVLIDIIISMFALEETESQVLAALGERLRRRRIVAGDTQEEAAARVGVSTPTYRKLEKGDPTSLAGTWIRALRLYAGLPDPDLLLPESLFDDDAQRQRVRRRRTP